MFQDKGKGFPTWKLEEIHKHTSYHGVMTKIDAEAKLRQHNGCNQCYLTRYSYRKKVFRLSVMWRKDRSDTEPMFKHFKLNIVKQDGEKRYEIEGTQKNFTDIVELLKYYQEYPISLEVYSIGDPIESPKPHFDETDDADKDDVSSSKVSKHANSQQKE